MLAVGRTLTTVASTGIATRGGWGIISPARIISYSISPIINVTFQKRLTVVTAPSAVTVTRPNVRAVMPVVRAGLNKVGKALTTWMFFAQSIQHFWNLL